MRWILLGAEMGGLQRLDEIWLLGFAAGIVLEHIGAETRRDLLCGPFRFQTLRFAIRIRAVMNLLLYAMFIDSKGRARPA